MGSLNNIVNVSITRQTSVPSRAGFGTGAFVSEDATFTTATKSYASYTEMSEDATVGADSLAFGAVYFGQQVAPTKLTVIKEGTGASQVGELVFDAALVDSNEIEIKIDGAEIAGSPVTYATPNADTLTAIAAAIQAEAGVTTAVSDGTDTITITFADEFAHTVEATVTLGASQAGAEYADTTPAATSIVACLVAAVNENNDWYAICIHSRTAGEILAVASWVQAQGSANPKLFFAQSSDAAILTADTTDAASVLQAKASFRTSIWYHADDAEYLDGGVIGGQLPSDAGSITWAYKTVSNVTVGTLTSGEKAYCHSKACNTYDTVASINITEEGKVSDSPFEWIDVIRGVDWLQTNLQADVYTVKVNNPKVPYTTEGLALIGATVSNRLATAQARGILSTDTKPVVVIPKIEDVPLEDKGNRVLNGVTFTGVLAGAIQKINIAGTVTL